MGLKSNVTSASHKDWFYHNLIHASHCQKNFPNVYKTYGVTVQSKSCLIYFALYISGTGFCISDGQCCLQL